MRTDAIVITRIECSVNIAMLQTVRHLCSSHMAAHFSHLCDWCRKCTVMQSLECTQTWWLSCVVWRLSLQFISLGFTVRAVAEILKCALSRSFQIAPRIGLHEQETVSLVIWCTGLACRGCAVRDVRCQLTDIPIVMTSTRGQHWREPTFVCSTCI